jgi:hypothetical protein
VNKCAGLSVASRGLPPKHKTAEGRDWYGRPMHWTDYAIKAVVYLTGPLMVLIGFIGFQGSELIVVPALVVTCLLVWLDDLYPPEERRPSR